MQETWRFEIGPKNISLSDGELVSELLRENKQDLGIFLSYYFRKQGAVAEDPRVLTTIQSTAPNIGHFELAFRLVYFNACLNIHELESDKMHITFKIDREARILEVTGPNWPEREMDEI